ncbi:MAG TPA: TetR/AcrR family transcriptional regulator [Gemmata sp.]|nr:TetR/AcrR family transcriptional regulator [Gemmata sp.]
MSREAILHAAARLVSTRGLEGLSIGDLAAEVGMSKSGLYAHFKSKEELELATIDTAVAIFDAEVLQPTSNAAAGLPRLNSLVDSFLSHLERRVFPGGCFFASVAAELDTRPGPARDRVAAVIEGWLKLLHQCIVDAQGAREIDPRADTDQAAFEIDAMIMAANYLFVMSNDATRLRQARKGVDNVLARLAVRTKGKKGAARSKK